LLIHQVDAIGLIIGSYRVIYWEWVVSASLETRSTGGPATASLLRGLRSFVVENRGRNQGHLACPGDSHWVGPPQTAAPRFSTTKARMARRRGGGPAPVNAVGPRANVMLSTN